MCHSGSSVWRNRESSSPSREIQHGDHAGEAEETEETEETGGAPPFAASNSSHATREGSKVRSRLRAGKDLRNSPTIAAGLPSV